MGFFPFVFKNGNEIILSLMAVKKRRFILPTNNIMAYNNLSWIFYGWMI